VSKCQFVVENISSKPIIKYEIRSIMKYDNLVDDGLGVSTEGFENLQPQQNANRSCWRSEC